MDWLCNGTQICVPFSSTSLTKKIYSPLMSILVHIDYFYIVLCIYIHFWWMICLSRRLEMIIILCPSPMSDAAHFWLCLKRVNGLLNNEIIFFVYLTTYLNVPSITIPASCSMLYMLCTKLCSILVGQRQHSRVFL